MIPSGSEYNTVLMERFEDTVPASWLDTSPPGKVLDVKGQPFMLLGLESQGPWLKRTWYRISNSPWSLGEEESWSLISADGTTTKGTEAKDLPTMRAGDTISVRSVVRAEDL